MTLDIFKGLNIEHKCLKLIYALDKIICHFESIKHVFTCCHNYFVVTSIYANLLEMVKNVCSFVKSLMEEDNEDFDVNLACYKNAPSVYGLDYLTEDLHSILNKIHLALEMKIVHEHTQYDILFELSHSIYGILKWFQSTHLKYLMSSKLNPFLHVYNFFLKYFSSFLKTANSQIRKECCTRRNQKPLA